MRKFIYSIFAVSLILTFNSCETTELDLLQSPTQVGQDQLDPQFLFNQIQLSFAGFASNTGGYASFSSQVTRQHAMTGSSVYPSAFSPTTFNGTWSAAYASVLNDIQALENFEGAAENYTYHLGVSKVMKAYVLFTLVDLFGDVPLEEALMGADVPNPSFDDQVSVYEAAFAALNEGRALLATGGGIEPLNDFYYGVSDGSPARWITAANSLELRTLNNARGGASSLSFDVTARINALLSANDLIDTPDEDFQFNYQANRVNPDSRHPGYSGNYENFASGYIANYMMWELAEEKGFDDPRLRYYFYRQDTNAQNEDIFTLGCSAQAAPGHYSSVNSIYDNTIDIPFCTAVPSEGYWGRDHGDNSGTPPDDEKRTVWGVYPAGGLFDAGQGDSAQEDGTLGLLGAGIQPILLSTHISFVKAEIALELGIGDASGNFEAAIRQSMDKVLNFGNLDPDTVVEAGVTFGDFFPTAANVDNYVNFVLTAFNDADDTQKLNILMKEHHIASFGNGLEVYNAYRRTGFPSNMQPSLNPNPGDFYRSAYYPANSVNNNPNASQADITRQVFWDNNPAGFIN